MNELTMNLVSRCLRDTLYNHISLIFMFYLLYRACGIEQYRPKTFVIVIELRMVLSLLVLNVMDVFYGEEVWYSSPS